MKSFPIIEVFVLALIIVVALSFGGPFVSTAFSADDTTTTIKWSPHVQASLGLSRRYPGPYGFVVGTLTLTGAELWRDGRFRTLDNGLHLGGLGVAIRPHVSGSGAPRLVVAIPVVTAIGHDSLSDANSSPCFSWQVGYLGTLRRDNGVYIALGLGFGRDYH